MYMSPKASLLNNFTLYSIKENMKVSEDLLQVLQRGKEKYLIPLYNLSLQISYLDKDKYIKETTLLHSTLIPWKGGSGHFYQNLIYLILFVQPIFYFVKL